MDNNTPGFTSYWRNTLADAESGIGAFERKDDDSFARWMTVEAGKLSDEIVHSFFDGEDAQVQAVEVTLAQNPVPFRNRIPA
ncbi:DNA helicase [Erwinia billingiae]|uniref:DNA helicase n=1 Tax=Erwinia billingiae TaxID=182337 RepID=UPI001246EFDA|nr:DNA helicase [Erwinia billingiae]